MTACAEHYGLPDELQDTSNKDTSRPSVVLHGKEGLTFESPSHNDLSQPSIALKDVKQHVTCALCNNLIASCLVLSCGHQYCGSCLFDWLGNKPSCPNCQVPLRAIPMRCIALDGVVESFLASMPDQVDVASYKARQEEGKSAANKVNKMFWWLQPSALPSMPAGGPTGFNGPPNGGVPPLGGMMGTKHQSFTSSLPQPLPTGGMMTAGMLGGYNSSKGPQQQTQGSMRRASQPGGAQHPAYPPRPGARSNSFSAGGAMPSCMAPPTLPPQMAASIAAAGFSAPAMSLPGGSAELEAAYLATAQKFGMEGLALPLVYHQQLHQQIQQQEQFRGLLHACSELQAVDLASPSTQTPFADPAQLQQLIQGLYLA